jgi:hypothetical protein
MLAALSYDSVNLKRAMSERQRQKDCALQRKWQAGAELVEILVE